MNRVGIGAQESVWLGWFLYDTLMRFADLCERAATGTWPLVPPGSRYQQARGKPGMEIGICAPTMVTARRWARLGTGARSIRAQSWAVLSGRGSQRAVRAMQSVSITWSPGGELNLLFTPPFDKT
jgi:cyclic beta-1,2-glucan synthetase